MKKAVLALLISLTLSYAFGGDTKNWKSVKMNNKYINLQIIPEIGGRILQYKLGDYGFFIIDPELYDKKPPASGVGPDNTWLNYGGDKLWIAPQGWENDQQWPGPPDPVLDGQPYKLEIINLKEIRLTSGEDKRSGVQLSRGIKIFEGTTRVSINATMKNIDNKPRRWGLWSHTQFDAGNRHGQGYNKNYWAYCPLNKNSIYHKGYSVIFGLVNNKSYQPDYPNNMMKVHYQYRVGKIGIDSTAGWTATVDQTDGYVFIHRFEYEPDKEYPDNSSVEIWLNGLGEFVAYHDIIKMSENIKDTPYIFENEILSPLTDLQPGQTYTFHYDFYSAKIPPDSGIIDCTEAGVVCQTVKAATKDNNINITGKFGVFYDGHLKISVLDKNGNQIETLTDAVKVSPLEEVILNYNTALSIDKSKAKTISVTLLNKNKKFIADLAKTAVTKK